MAAGRAPRRHLRRLARTLVRALGIPLAAVVERLLRFSGLRAGVALAYHSIAERSGRPETELVPPHALSLYESQLRHLAARYRIVPASELPDAVACRRRGERFPVAITFDDDLASHVYLALPTLRRLGMQATFFLSGASLSAPFSFWWERLQRAYDTETPGIDEVVEAVAGERGRASFRSIHEVGRMIEALEPSAREAFATRLTDAIGADPPDAGLRAEDVRVLAEARMEIGFHTRRHDPLMGLPDTALEEALREGRRELEGLVGRPLSVIGYPHGRADARVAAAARRASFDLGYTTVPRGIRPEADRLLLGRVNPSYRSAGHLALQILQALLTSHR